MEDKLKEMKENSVLNDIHFDRDNQNSVYNKLSSRPEKQSRWLKGVLGSMVCLGVLAFVLFIALPNNFFQNNNNAPQTGKDNEKSVKAIQTFLQLEFTGPSDDLNSMIDKNHPKLNLYLEEKYKPLFMKGSFKNFVNTNRTLYWLTPASHYGFQLNPKSIDIQKVEQNIYQFKVNVAYTKDGNTKSTMVTGFINLDEKGKISSIRNIDDHGLKEKMVSKP